MLSAGPTLQQAATAARPLGAGLVLGLAYRLIVLNVLRHRVERWRWSGGSAVLAALGSMPVLWLVLAGLYGALRALPFQPGVLSAAQKAIAVVAVLSVTWVAARAAAALVQLWADRSEGVLPGMTIFSNLTRALVAFIGLLVLLQYLGYSITPMLTALGVGGLALALALQDTLSNLFAGFHILASRQVRPGDYVKLASGEEGYIEDITWRNTRIRALPNNLIIVPNATLAGSIVTNYFLPDRELSVLVQVGVSYGSDLETVEAVSVDVARETLREVPGAVPDFQPVVRFHTFDDSSVNFTMVLRASEYGDQYLLKHEFIKRLHARYAREGIEIPFPIRTVLLRSEEAGAD